VSEKVAELRRQLAKVSEEIDRLEALPEDDFADGDVIQFKRRFPDGGPWYQYVAIKIDGRWHMSGKAWHHFTAWETLAGLLMSDLTKDAWFAETWQELDW
jgi:hypothetical protein